MSYSFPTLLELAVKEKASDIHLHSDGSPFLRIDGELSEVKGVTLSEQDLYEAIQNLVPDKGLMEDLKKNKNIDFSFVFQNSFYFRVNAFYCMGHLRSVMRQISGETRTFEEIGLPTATLEKILSSRNGLILITGPTGSGKSTTLSAMIDWLNQKNHGHIITFEDPIEYIHSNKNCIVSQRELGRDMLSFASAIRGALRQDPNILLVGEMRDLETMEAALSAAETGQLVLATLHTTGASRTVDRIIDVFPAETKEYIRSQLASNLVAVISQILCRKKSGGRVAAFEIMTKTDSISALIRENKSFRLLSEIQLGSKDGMVAFDSCLLKLYKQGIIEMEEALNKAQYPLELSKQIQEQTISFKI